VESIATWSELKRLTGLQKDIKQLCDIYYLWNNKKERKIINMIHVALLRAIWLRRNDLVFNHVVWPSIQTLWRSTACLLSQWEILVPKGERGRLKAMGA
jgi:hypothetical protein